jgi:uncharacterized protein (TIGR03437 family)
MNIRLAVASAVVSLFTSVAFAQTTPAQIVRFRTNLGDIDVTLLPSSAPKTVANFLKYVNRGSYNNSIIHRSVRNFVIQGGGYQLQNNARVEIKDDGKVANEYSVPNTRGTIAMAKLGGDPNSATTQWFFNLGNNNGLNTDNGGYTVFGRVNNSAGLAIMDKIAALPIVQLAAPFDTIPLINYPGGDPPDESYVQILSLAILPPPSITANGIVTASSFGGFPLAAPGSFIEIYGSDLAGTTRGWTTEDFVNGNAPVSLDGVIVTVDGRQGYISFVSPTQLNVQVPAGISTDKEVPVVVYYKNQASAPVNLTMKPLAPGLLAPPTFKVGDKQYVVAVHSSTSAFVSNGSIPGVPEAPALPGETLVFYGVGFGPVSSPSNVPVAGKVVEGTTALSTSAQFKFGETTGQNQFSGLIQGLVGVYQFNVTVPANAPNGDVPLTVLLGSENVPQTLFIPVKN